MRKLNVLLAALAVGLAVLFASCGFDAGMQTLSKDDIKSDWVDGYWSGDIITTADDGEPKTITWNHKYWTADELKALWTIKGSANVGDLVGASVDVKVESNLARNKLFIKQTTKATLLGTTTTTVVKYQLTKDK